MKGFLQFMTLSRGVATFFVELAISSYVMRVWGLHHNLSLLQGMLFHLHEDAAWIFVELVSIFVSGPLIQKYQKLQRSLGPYKELQPTLSPSTRPERI